MANREPRTVEERVGFISMVAKLAKLHNIATIDNFVVIALWIQLQTLLLLEQAALRPTLQDGMVSGKVSGLLWSVYA